MKFKKKHYINYSFSDTLISCEVLDTILLRVGSLHRLLGTWNHDDYIIAAQIFHGTRPVGTPVLSEAMTLSNSFYPRVLFNTWLVNVYSNSRFLLSNVFNQF